MNKTPKSFVMMLRRRYRVYFNPQGGGWYVAYNDGVNRQRKSLGALNRPEAEAAVKSMDEPPTAAQQAKHRAMWDDVQKGFLEHKASLDLAPASLDRYEAALKAFGRHIRSAGVQYVDEISLTVLEGFKRFRVEKETCDVNTAYHNSIVVKGAFKWAAKGARGYLVVNPALDWETPRPVKPKRKTYTAVDVEKMEADVCEWLRPIVTVLAWTGMRINELVNLRWQDVDLEKRLIHVRVQESWKPKGKKDRTIPMHSKVETILKAQPLGTYVFTTKRGKPLLASSTLRSLHAEQSKLGLDAGDLHAFRRYFATTMIRNGVDAETVRQWGGWKSFNTMLRYLADVNASDSVKAMNAAENRINAASEKSDKEMTKKLA